ncbi:MAG: PKD domain-containing protein, partial [Bacteroidetes bacterium]|nr:PKD domain-containing protein [Bacteroidota bacterium]
SSGNTSGNYNTFENCLLRGGYYGFYNYGGGSSAYTYGNSLINCDLYQIYYYPVYAYYGRDRYLVSNNIDSIRNSSGYGMMLGYGNNDSIAGNYVRASGSYAVYGYYWNVYGNSTDTTYFVNNMIVGGSSYGLYGSLGYRNLFYGNSFYSSNSSGCVYYGSSMTSCEFKNNSFYNNSGYAGYWGSISGINAGAFDYNNYYAPNSSYLVYFDGDRTDLSALKSAYTSYNANSISVNPEYTSTTDLHSESVNLNNLGINMPRFAVDFDGDPRPTSPDTKFDIGADDYWLPEYDADIVGFSPTSLAAGSNSIGILIKNNGIKTWGSTDSIFVEYSIGGGSTVKDTVYPSSVAPDNTTLFTFTTPYTYTGSGTYVDACATFSRQFNNYDPDALDESYCQDMCVGGKNLVIVDASGQGDFSTIDSAVAYFNCVGLTAASTIRVKAGTYNEQVNLTQISGASSSNTLRIVGEGADQSIISYTSNGTGYYSTVRFAGADYVTIDSMGIEAKGSTYAWGVQMIDSANYNTISNCSISVPIGSSSSYWVPVVLSGSNNNPTSTGNNCSYNTFENNAISGGYYGVTLFGTAPYWRLTGNEFLNNTFTGHYYYGLYGYYTEGTLFKGNTMTDFTYDYGYALYFNYCTANTIEANKIMGSGYGLYMYYENYYASSNSSYIVNNMIGEYTYYGIYTDYYTFNPYILHNSVWSANGYYPLYAYYNYYPRIVNNVFVNTNGNYASYLYYGTRTNSDIAYNNYYAPNSYYTFYHDGSSYTDLSSYTASISGIAANSVERDPSFISTSDFHSYSDSINNIGDNTRSWATDFDGDARPTSPDTRVDMGADDYWIPLYDLDVLSVDSPSSIGIGSYPIVATFQNRGLRNLTGKTAWVSYQINGGTLVKDTIDCKFLKVGHDTTFTFTQNWNVSAEGSYSICVGVDTIISQTSDGRDEVCVSKCTGVADTLVVDPSGNGDFLTISEAIDKIGCGVLGPVVVYIKNGNYSESATLITPGGSSSVNNIQFIGESRTGVIWDNDGANATILFSNAAYYSFRDMSIINSHTATSNGVAVQMTDSSHHISFDNCDFRVSTATSNSSVAVLVTSAEDVGYYTGLRAATNIELSNCLLSGGYYGAFLIGRNTTDVDTNFVFEDCAFENQYYTALRVYQIGALTVHNSDFRDFRSTSPMAINMYYTQRSTLTQNRIVSKGYGIYANYDNYYGSGMDSSVYANNQIFQNNFNGNAYYGWYAYYCYYQRFYHNTLVTTTNSSSTTGAAIYLTGALYGTKVKNNNVFAANGGYLLYDGSFGTSAGDIDYNNYYSPVSFRVYQGAMWSSLASWQSGNTSYNQQSVSVNPYFNNLDSLEGLKAASAYLINAGTGLAIGTDWEGETRDALRPDIGADEIYKDFNLLKATGPGNQCRNLGDMDSVAIKIQNTGTVAFVEGDTLIVRYTAASVTQSDTLVVPTGLFFNPGDTVNHTFNEPMASGTPGANRPVIVGAYHRDNNALNDTFKHYFYTNPYPSAAFAVGDTCEYDASAFRNTSTVTIGNIATNGWLFGDGNTSSDESPAHGYGTYDTFSVRLVIATDSGCTDTAYGQAVTHPKPVASFSTANVCDGKTANFTNASSLAHGSLTYAWDMGDNTNTSTATNPSLTYGADGSYTVEMIANSDQGCSDTASQAITIYPTPAAAFTATEACQGDATEFTNGSTISNGSFSNRWEFGNGNTSTATNPTETYSAAGTYSVELLVGTSNGCADSLTKSVTVNPLPKSIFTANNMCYGDVMGLTNTSTGAGLSYKWYYGDGNTSTSQLPSYTYANPGTYTVSLVVTTNKGCTDSSSTSVTVANQPLAAFSVSNDCVHNGITFNNATSVACGAVSYYYWYYGDGSGDTLTSLSNPVHYYSAAGTYSVKLVIELSNSVRDSVTRTVTVYGQPTAAFTNTASCEGNLMQFTNTSSALTGTSLKSFAWTFGDGGSSALKNPTNTYSNSGGYNVRMIATDSRNCSDTVLTALTVSPNPAADFSYANACAYDALALTNKSTISSGTIAAYAWDFGNNTGSSSASPSVTYGTAGYYQVKMVATSSAGCKDSATKTVQAYASPSGGFSTSDVCLNEASSFTNQSSGATTYAWDFGNNSGTSTSTSPSYTYSGANTYTVSLVASNANGCRDTATGQATVNALPSASFSTADVCHGTAVSFSNGSSGASTYSWSYGDGQGSSLSSPSHTYSNAGTYDISLIAVTSKGCRDTADGSVTVNANPVVSISAGDECAYDEVSFANSTTGASSYAWTFGDGSGSSTAAPSHLYTNPGTYNAVLTATSSASCTTKDSLSVDVFAVPSASFTSKDACTGTANAFSNTSSISTGTMAHSWDFGDNSGTSNNTSPSYTYSIAGTYSVELISTSNNGCSDTATGTATVNALPSPDFTFSDVCLGSAMSFSNKSSGASSYSWSFGDGKTSTTTSPSNTYTVDGQYTVTLLATSSAGCTSSVSKTVTVYGLPTASFTATNECLGDAMTTTNLSSGASSYSWSFGDGNSSTSTAPSHTYGKSGSYTVNLTATSSNGCTSQKSASVTVYALPTASFSANTACQGSATTFSNSSNGASTYTWNFGDGTSSTLENPSRTYAADGTYKVTLTALSAEGCSDDVTVDVTVNEQPTAAFSASTECSGDTTAFTNLSTGTISTYAWNLGNGNSSSDANPSQVYTQGGSYTVELTVATSQGCSDKASQTVTVYSTPSAVFTTGNACLSDAASFDDNGSSGNGALLADREFTFGDGNNAFGRSATHTYAQHGDYTVSYKVTTVNGCSHTATTQITLYPMPALAVGAHDTCSGDALTFVNNSTIASGTMTYGWSFGEGSTSTDAAPTHTYDTMGTYTVSVAAISDMGCISDESFDVQVFPTPDALFVAGEVCVGDSARFQNHSEVAKGSISYEWSFGDGSVSSDEHPYHHYDTFGVFTVTMRVVSNKACANTYSLDYEVHEQPMAFLLLPPTCLGDSTKVPQAVLDAVRSDWSYRLTLGDGTVLTEVPSGYVYTHPGVYNAGLSIQTPFGCFDSASVDVTILPLPVMEDWAYTRLENQEISFGVTNADDSLEYAWDFGDGSVASGSSANHTFGGAGTYTVTCTATNGVGCSVVISKEVEVYPVGISEMAGAMHITAFPNPYTNWVKLDYTLDRNAYVRIEVLDMTGRRVAVVADGQQLAGNQALLLDEHHLPFAAGGAVVKVVVDNEVIFINLMKLR